MALSRLGDNVGIGVPPGDTFELFRECRPSVGLCPALRFLGLRLPGLGGLKEGCVVVVDVSMGGKLRKLLDDALLLPANDGLGCSGVASVKSWGSVLAALSILSSGSSTKISGTLI